MYSSLGLTIDGSYDLQITIQLDDTQVTQSIPVRGDSHVGEVIYKLTEALGLHNDWSEYVLWWEEKRLWLKRTAATLDQYGVLADAKLAFTRPHKPIKLILPDLQVLDFYVDFSIDVFDVVEFICARLSIRRYEELSLQCLLRRKYDRKSRSQRNPQANPDTITPPTPDSANNTAASPNNSVTTPGPGGGGFFHGGGGGTLRSSSHSPHNTLSLNRNSQSYLLNSPGTPPTGTLKSLPGSPFHYGTYRGTPPSPYTSNGSLYGGGTIPSTPNGHYSMRLSHLNSMDPDDTIFTNSPVTSTKEALTKLYKPKLFADKAKLNMWWLDTSCSLMEQGVREGTPVYLRYKFFNFYDINVKYDQVRINQIYEQAKWSIITELIECSSEEEMIMFAALQYQIQVRGSVESGIAGPGGGDGGDFMDDVDGSRGGGTVSPSDDLITAALNELEVSLDGGSRNSAPPPDITCVPELQDYLQYSKHKKILNLKGYKRYFLTLKDLHLCIFKSKEVAIANGTPVSSLILKGCEVAPQVNLSSNKFTIKLYTPPSPSSSHILSSNGGGGGSPSPQQGMDEHLIRCSNENQYVRWMAAFRLAAQGKTMADSSYEAECQSITAFLNMQRPAAGTIINNNLANGGESSNSTDKRKSAGTNANGGANINGAVNEASPSSPPGTPTDGTNRISTNCDNDSDFRIEDYIATKFIKKLKTKQMINRILEAHAHISHMSGIDAKLSYIKAWQALTDYGVSHFIVRFKGSRREEMLGVAHNRMTRMDKDTGEHIKTWKFYNMKSWDVNWQRKEVRIQFEEEVVEFSPSSSDCKTLHEYIGGYIFLSLRSHDKNQSINKEQYHQLTGGS